MWRQLDKIEEEMLHNEIISEPFYDDIFGIPFDFEYVEPEVGWESELKSYEAVPGDDQLKEPKTNHKKNQDHSGTHRQPNLFKKMDPREQTVKQKQAHLVEEAVVAKKLCWPWQCFSMEIGTSLVKFGTTARYLVAQAAGPRPSRSWEDGGLRH